MSRALRTALLACSMAAAAQETLVVEPVHKLRPGVDAIPAVKAPTTPAVSVINASTARQNRAIVAQFRDCDISYRQWARRVGQKRKFTRGDWERNVWMTMSGPRYLSFVVSDFTFCGGAHPNTDQFALVYDLTTGKPVNWTQLLRNAEATSDLTAADDGTRVGMVQSAKLRAMFVQNLDEECKQAVQDDMSGFILWPDGKAGTLMVAMPQVPHVVAVCGEPQKLTASQLRELGLRDEMLTELERK